MSEIVDRLRELAAAPTFEPEPKRGHASGLWITVSQDEARDIIALIDQLSHHELP